MVAETPQQPTLTPTLKNCLRVGLVGFALSFAIILCIGHEPLQPIDQAISDGLKVSREASPEAKHFFAGVTELAGFLVMMGLLIGVAIVLLHYGRYLLAFAWVFAVEIAWTANDRLLKHLFQRPRPFDNSYRPYGPPDWSFPSGHSLRGIVLYGFLAYLLILVLPRRWARIIAVGALAGVVLLVGFSRVYLGKHYTSDVIGGFTFGAVWLALWIAQIEVNGWCTQQRFDWHQRLLERLRLARPTVPASPPPVPSQPAASPSANAPGV
jgi:undecaprenyl-diphosphatase